MALRNKAFHQLRQLFQQHTARWQHELPDLTKPQYAVMRAIADSCFYQCHLFDTRFISNG
ncbi:hypothetical protein ACUOFC_07910, partial [Escherichia sp. TWPC-MK]